MQIDVKTGLFGFILGGISGLGIGQVIDSDLKLLESLAQLGSFLGGVGTILASAIAFLVYKRWYRQHEFPEARKKLDEIRSSLMDILQALQKHHTENKAIRDGNKKKDKATQLAFGQVIDSISNYIVVHSQLKNCFPDSQALEHLRPGKIVPGLGLLVNPTEQALKEKEQLIGNALAEVRTLNQNLRDYF